MKKMRENAAMCAELRRNEEEAAQIMRQAMAADANGAAAVEVTQSPRQVRTCLPRARISARARACCQLTHCAYDGTVRCVRQLGQARKVHDRRCLLGAFALSLHHKS